jgi:hypothetical protein
VDGLQGLNIRATFPFKFDDYVVGFRHSFTSFGRAPDSLFVRRSFATGDLGTATVDAEYNTLANVGHLKTGWHSPRLGLDVNVEGDTKSKFRNAEVALVQRVLALTAQYLVLLDWFLCLGAGVKRWCRCWL